MDAATELGRNPVTKHQIQPENGDEQADAGRDCRTRLAKPNYTALSLCEGLTVSWKGLNESTSQAEEV